MRLLGLFYKGKLNEASSLSSSSLEFSDVCQTGTLLARDVLSLNSNLIM